MTRLALLAALLLAGCDRASPSPAEDLATTDEAARAAVIANEQAWIEQMRADTERNAAIAAELENLAYAEDPFANLFTPEPEPVNDIAAEAFTPAPPPSEAELRAAETAVRAAMEQRRAGKE